MSPATTGIARPSKSSPAALDSGERPSSGAPMNLVGERVAHRRVPAPAARVMEPALVLDAAAVPAQPDAREVGLEGRVAAAAAGVRLRPLSARASTSPPNQNSVCGREPQFGQVSLSAIVQSLASAAGA